MASATPLAAPLAAAASLPPPLQRAVASLLGATVADAAARPLHWVYDMAEMAELLEQNRNVEFWPESRSPFYSLPTGARSCYSHVLMAGLRAFTEAAGEPDLAVYSAELTRTFGEGTEWQEALARRGEAYTPAKRREKRRPVAGPWLHGAVITFLAEGRGPADNTEMDAFLLCLPHLVLRAGRAGVVEECLSIASLLSGVTHWVATQAEVLRAVVEEGGLSRGRAEELELPAEGWAALEQVWEQVEEEHTTAVASWGNNCHLPGSMQGALHAFLRHQEGEGGFGPAVRETIAAGGCNCSRGNYLGALLGAQGGLDSIPTHWAERVTDVDSLLGLMVRAAALVAAE